MSKNKTMILMLCSIFLFGCTGVERIEGYHIQAALEACESRQGVANLNRVTDVLVCNDGKALSLSAAVKDRIARIEGEHKNAVE